MPPSLTYTPLCREDNIRLLVLAPGEDSSPLSATFVETTTGTVETTPYECLSYTWGQPGNEIPISVNDCTMAIRPNLHAFLTKLRKLDKPRNLWVDAICINQGDDEEKGRQVGMMGSVFGHATQVLAWVGEHSDGSEALFRPWLKRKGGNLHAPLGTCKTSVPTLEQARRRSIWIPFLMREYWTRTWIVQEVVLAKQVLVHCGHAVLSWEELFQNRMDAPEDRKGMPFNLDGVAFGKEHYSDQLRHVREICYERYDRVGRTHGRGSSLTHLVARYGNITTCSNPFDKVCAFLAMQTAPKHPVIVADYKHDVVAHLLCLWLYGSDIEDPLPLMTALGFTNDNSCHFLDFFLDRIELNGKRETVGIEPLSLEARCSIYDTFLKAIQAVVYREHRYAKWRLTKGTPPKTNWYAYPSHHADGRPMTMHERHSRLEHRAREERDLLASARTFFRSKGQWPPPSVLSSEQFLSLKNWGEGRRPSRSGTDLRQLWAENRHKEVKDEFVRVQEERYRVQQERFRVQEELDRVQQLDRQLESESFQALLDPFQQLQEWETLGMTQAVRNQAERERAQHIIQARLAGGHEVQQMCRRQKASFETGQEQQPYKKRRQNLRRLYIMAEVFQFDHELSREDLEAARAVDFEIDCELARAFPIGPPGLSLDMDDYTFWFLQMHTGFD